MSLGAFEIKLKKYFITKLRESYFLNWDKLKKLFLAGI